jgi:hypothetical protein
MPELLTCLLCGATDRNVVHTWARFKEPNEAGESFGVIDRCKNRVACAQRVEVNGDTWPVYDGTFR